MILQKRANGVDGPVFLLAANDPILRIEVPAASVDIEHPIRMTMSRDPELPMTPIEGTDYSYRVRFLQDGLRMSGGEVISVAAVEIKSPQRTFVRWVCDDPTRNRDLPASDDAAAAHGEALEMDPNIIMEYTPGAFPAAVDRVLDDPAAFSPRAWAEERGGHARFARSWQSALAEVCHAG